MTTPDYSQRLASLRAQIAAAGYDGFILPVADEYQSDHVPPFANRVAFLTGFTGSAATVVVLNAKAAFFTDSRYTLQARQQVDDPLFTIFDAAEVTPLDWLKMNVSKGARIAYDPWLHTLSGVERLKKALAEAFAEAVAASQNFVDLVRGGRPRPGVPAVPHPLVFAGITSVEKRKRIAAELKRKNVGAVILASPSSIAWLLNIRGGDIPCTPLCLCRAILHDDATVRLFIDPQKVSPAFLSFLGCDVAVEDPDALAAALERLANGAKAVLIDPTSTPGWIADYLTENRALVIHGDDPCALPQATKNNVELLGMRAAHIREGAAVTTLLAWLDVQDDKSAISELDVVRQMETLRQANIHYKGASFETIAAVGANAAMAHYEPSEASDTPLSAAPLFLLDTGGQYLDGTTDVTRTVAIGGVTADMRENFTRVLKGHIALVSARFPEGVTGADLDVLARQYLWAVGRDYGHGTGHGVGSFLGVHEGPQAISRRSKTPLSPGMVITIEPGYYKARAYGIRIENVATVVEIAGLPGAEHKTLGFDILTLVPIDRRMIDVAFLTETEIEWINHYHERVRKQLEPLVDADVACWLRAATEPIARP